MRPFSTCFTYSCILTWATSAQNITSTPLATEEVSDHSNSKGHGGLDTLYMTVAMHAVQALGQCRTGGRVRGGLAGEGVGCGCGRAARHTHRRRRTVWHSDRPLAAPLPSGTGTWTSAMPWTRQAALLTLLHALQPTWKVSFGVQIFPCKHRSSSHIRKDCRRHEPCVLMLLGLILAITLVPLWDMLAQ